MRNGQMQPVRPMLSLVAPVFNEEAVIDAFCARVIPTLNDITPHWEIVFVNDGSRDGTVAAVERQHTADSRIALVSLSRNFGKEIAMTAGLDLTRGDAVVIIDVDLQDPPELIKDLVAKWREGNDVVFARRLEREGETLVKRLTAYGFYRALNAIADRHIPPDVGDFRLMSRRAVDALLRVRERHRFMKGLYAWIGFRQAEVPYVRAPRAAGATKFNYWRLWNFSIEGFTSFSIRPLQMASYFGFTIAVLAVLYGSFIVLRTLLYGNPVAGYPSLLVVVLFMGGVQLISLGVIGEYLGRVFNETKQRPLYLVADLVPSRYSVPPDEASLLSTASAATYPD
jgi:polyisoprenyl-phosphate glycosyltransferase